MSSRATRAAVLGLTAVITYGCAHDSDTRKPVKEVIPVTAANIRGHEMLYREGWTVVSSTEKALAFAKEHSVESSGTAMQRMMNDLRRGGRQYDTAVIKGAKGAVDTGESILKKGTALTGKELAFTHELAQAEINYGNEAMAKAWDKLIRGNLTLGARTAEDREALANVPGNFYRDLKRDFSNLAELTRDVNAKASTGIEGRWSEAMTEARKDFKTAYEKSGTRGNALAGLGDIFAGYANVVYSGLIKPTTRSTVQGGEAVAKVAGNVIFLPVASLYIVAERTVVSTGLTLYYTTSMGVSLVAPTVESGLLAGLSILSYGSAPLTYAAGGTVGLVNQVAVVAAAPVAAAGEAAAVTAGQTLKHAAFMSYDVAKGVTTVAVNQVQSGVVLGYNALTALPTQVVLGAANGVVFVVWDGPRLAIASAKGEVAWGDDTSARVPVQNLPVGSVVDLDALRKQPGVQVEIISDDPDVVQKVIENLPDDLRRRESGATPAPASPTKRPDSHTRQGTP